MFFEDVLSGKYYFYKNCLTRDLSILRHVKLFVMYAHATCHLISIETPKKSSE